MKFTRLCFFWSRLRSGAESGLESNTSSGINVNMVIGIVSH